MEGDRRVSIMVGGFVLAALAAFGVTVLSLSAEQGFFRERYGLVAYYTNVQGLLPGAAVRLAGTRVGQVAKVELAARPDGRPAVRALLRIDDAVRHRITDDSVARIATVGLLGDQIIEISIGTTGEPLAPGSEIATIEPFDLSRVVSQAPALIETFQSIEVRGSRALEQLETLAGNLNESVEEFQQLQGGRRLAESLRGLSEIVDEVQGGDGTLHALVYDPLEGDTVANLDRSIESFAHVMGEVESGDGFLHSLVYDDSSEQAVLRQMTEAGARLNSILAKIDSGQGTLGLMVNDPTLYDELKLLVGGAGRSRVLRTLIDLTTDSNP